MHIRTLVKDAANMILDTLVFRSGFAVLLSVRRRRRPLSRCGTLPCRRSCGSPLCDRPYSRGTTTNERGSPPHHATTPSQRAKNKLHTQTIHNDSSSAHWRSSSTVDLMYTACVQGGCVINLCNSANCLCSVRLHGCLNCGRKTGPYDTAGPGGAKMTGRRAVTRVRIVATHAVLRCRSTALPCCTSRMPGVGHLKTTRASASSPHNRAVANGLQHLADAHA